MPSIKKRVTGFIRQLSAPAGSNNSATGGASTHVEAANKTGNKTSKPEIKVTSATITDEAFHQRAAAGCFIQKYLSGESHQAGPPILCGKTGHDLPVYKVSLELDPEVFATFTGPDGGLTSISRLEDRLHNSMMMQVKEFTFLSHALFRLFDRFSQKCILVHTKKCSGFPFSVEKIN